MSRRTPRGGTKTRPHGRDIGRPTALTERTADAIIHTVLQGNHITTACASAGISRAALYNWVTRGEAAKALTDQGKEVPDSELAFLDFVDRLSDARAQAEIRAVEVVERSMRGGFVISEEPLQDSEGNAVYDSNTGEVLYKRTYSQPDGRLALSYLAKSRPDTWGQNPTNRIELTGAGGGPVQVEGPDEDRIARLSARLALVAAQRRAEAAEAAEAAGEVVDAELVVDDDGGDES